MPDIDPALHRPPAPRANPATSRARLYLRGGWGPVLLGLSVGLLALAATFFAWRFATSELSRSRQGEFDFQVRQSAKRIEQQMATYQQVQRGTQAFLLGSMEVRRDDFRLFVQSLRLDENYPGIQGIALVRALAPEQVAAHVAAVRAEGLDYELHPPAPRPAYSAISHIEPYTGLNPRALGFDMLSEPVRRAAMERARDSGQAAASGKVRLIQENGRQPQAGLVMYVPVYRRGAPIHSVELRRRHLQGWVGAPFRMDDLMAGLGGERSRDITLSIYDGSVITGQAQLYSSDSAASADSATGAAAGAAVARPMFSATRQIDIAGRNWTLHMRSAPSFEARLQSDWPRNAAVAGGLASVLLALLVWSLASGRRRALALATQATRQLRDSEFRWKYALEGAGDGVWDFDRSTGAIVYSRRWKAMLGYDEADIDESNEGWLALIHPDDLGATLATLDAYAASTSLSYEAQYRMRCKDGGWRWIRARAMAVSRDAEGKPLRTIGTHTDITDAKRGERTLDEARNALAHAQKLEAVGKLTGGVAHDFNNVLHVIGGNVQLMQHMNKGDERLQQRLRSVQSAVDKGAKLSSQLLAFARRQPLQPVVLNPLRSVRRMEDLLQRALGETILIQIAGGAAAADTAAAGDMATYNAGDEDACGGGWNTQVDPGQWENVVLNLAINARDAMPGGGILGIAVHNARLDQEQARAMVDIAAGDYVKVTLSDTGAGMSEEVRAMAFEPFFTTKPVGQGTGLGLSMAYGFVKQSGGHIQIDSEKGRGTTITILLPRCAQAEAEAEAEAESEPEAGGGQLGAAQQVPGGDETILVVEDDAQVRATTVSILSALGYRVLDAHDGQSALDMIKGGAAIDLLFTDVVMPGPVSSTELAAMAQRIVPALAVLFTSGYTRDVLTTGGRLDPGVQLLGKPYREDQLAQRIRETLRRAVRA